MNRMLATVAMAAATLGAAALAQTAVADADPAHLIRAPWVANLVGRFQ